ncbi:hypothetical protein COB57_02375 [Candidatus Peregrinibacteria bacterium]|nr:MAG: hypothetical protein COB57_02375 [Candidatus Peregrinibacteria bacterium]
MPLSFLNPVINEETSIQELENLLDTARKNYESLRKTEKEFWTFESIITPLFYHLHELQTTFSAYQNIDGVMSSDTSRKIIQIFQPQLVDFYNIMSFDTLMYEICIFIKDNDTLSSEQRRSVELLLEDFINSGVHLAEEEKSELKKINLQLNKISEKFSNNTLDDKKIFFHHCSDNTDISEIAKTDLDTAKQEAKERNLDGWVFTLSPPSYLAIQKECKNQGIRKLFYEKYHSVATSDTHSNKHLVLETLQLREQRAHILGHNNHAEYVFTQRMANTPSEVITKITELNILSKQKAKKELKELKNHFQLSEIFPWDISYYSEILKKEKFHINAKQIRQHFPLEQVIHGLFTIANKLYDITIEATDEKTYHPDVHIYKVFQEEELIAYYVMDIFSRSEKQSGAWCNDIRKRLKKENGEQEVPVVINVGNFGKGDPTLLTHYEVLVLFHEFGHALHVMLSQNTIENTSGFSTEWDFVELPSQCMENWVWEKESLDLFSQHYETKDPLPPELCENLKKTKSFMSGLRIARQSEMTLLDMMFHTRPAPHSIEELENIIKDNKKNFGIFSQEYGMYCSFSHIFAGGYSAGYYSYFWAEFLEAEVFEEFLQNGIFNTETADKYYQNILSQGAKKPGKQLFHDFMGREMNVSAFLKKYEL